MVINSVSAGGTDGTLVSGIDGALVSGINSMLVGSEVGVAFKSADDLLVSGIDSV